MAAIKRTVRERIARLRRTLRRLGAPAMLVTHPVNVGYLSGFTGEDSWLLVGPGRPALITDSRYAEQAERECPGVAVVVRRGAMVEALQKQVRRRRFSRLAFEPREVTVALRSALGKALRGVRLVQAAKVIEALRIRKDAGEIRSIRRAVAVAEAAWEPFRAAIRPGMTERELAAELDHRLRQAGSDGPPFPTICAVDASASMPHAKPSGRRLRKGSVLLVDFGARVGGYVCDLTRCLFVGRIPPHVRDAYTIVFEAQAAAIARAAPGVGFSDVDAAAREVIRAAGLGEAFQHGVGHGLGREVHEPPALSPRADPGRLEPGMVFTIEPGVYLRGRFGIRIEDDVVVTGRGRRVLTSLAKEPEAMVL